MHLNTLTIAQARKGLDTKEFSATELVSDCFDAITKHDPEIRAFLDVYGDALAEAKRRDEDLSNNHAPPATLWHPPCHKRQHTDTGPHLHCGLTYAQKLSGELRCHSYI